MGSDMKGTLPLLWRRFRVEVLFVIALVVTLLLSGWMTHPGILLVEVTILLDILLWRRLVHTGSVAVSALTLVLNVLALIVLFVGGSKGDLWLSGLLGLFALLLLAFSRPDNTDSENSQF
ncbi:hypothetical protein D2Q93_13185 [Alicyclobacillaceae bacterium I2511]|nr:hypothetical protein D2Q93_13185 [Alicyclobacillaceae bacterium I2511]